MKEKRNMKESGGRRVYAINLDTFSRRIKALYSHWHQYKDELWGCCDIISISTPPPSQDFRYLKSSALNMWLLGYEFPDTIMVFGKKQFHFICSQKKASLLEVVKRSAREAVNLDVFIHVKKSKSDDGIDLMDSVLNAVFPHGCDAALIGHLAREVYEGKLLETWAKRLKKSGLQLCDVTSGLSDLFGVKEKTEIINTKRAAYLTASAMNNYVVPKLENVIDDGKKVMHSSLMDETEKAILQPRRVKTKFKSENVDICYPPIFQSGGSFDLRPTASSNDDHLYYDSASVIICALGSRYNNYCANIGRTFLIDSNAMQRKAYKVLLKAQEAAINALGPGIKFSDVYQAAVAVVERDAPDLVPSLTKSSGAGIGLEFRESSLSLNSKNNNRIMKPGMVLNVSLGFQNLHTQTHNMKSQNFSLLLADTVIVTPEGRDVVTRFSSKALKDVAYSFSESEEDVEKLPPRDGVNLRDRLTSKATLRSDNHKAKEEHRKQHQAELARQKTKETYSRLSGVGLKTENNRTSGRGSSEIVAYTSVNDLPPPREMMIQVDQKNEAILLPIYGSLVPFHVSTVRTVVSQADPTRVCYIRITFNLPGNPDNPNDASSLNNQGTICLKEVSFRSKDPSHIDEIFQKINKLRRKTKARESERAERATLVTQEKLTLAENRFRPLRLSGLSVRPPLGGRQRNKLQGVVEAHLNGFRYSTSTKEKCDDILFGNIKHAFFQPAEKEMITLIHFHLFDHIMVGNKKTKDVQFYVEVMDAVQSLGGGRSSAYDPDEIIEERRERERKNKTNMDFQTFVNRVNELWGQPQFRGLDLEFEQTLRELGFHGVPDKSLAFVVPTSSCLVELMDPRFFVLTLSEIEIVSLERVNLARKSFDMVIVFKDFKRKVIAITSIPSSSLDGIKEWLDTTDIKFYESNLSLNWDPILKTIMDNPDDFVEDGGWEFLNLEGSDEDSEISEESEQGYMPSDAEPDSEMEDDDSDSESVVKSEDEEDDSEEDSEEEEGKTWDELEREASNADREKGGESDSDEDRRSRKKSFAKARVGSSSRSSPKRQKKFM